MMKEGYVCEFHSAAILAPTNQSPMAKKNQPQRRPNDMVSVRDNAPRMNGKVTTMKFIAYEGLKDEKVDVSGKTILRYTLVNAQGAGE